MAKAWDSFNSEDNWLPFLLPLGFWTSCILYCYLPTTSSKRREFHRWSALHNVHNFGAIALGLVSMYFNDDSIFNERIPILWSLAYFIIDLIECLWRFDVQYTVHAIFCLILGVSNYTTPICRLLRMNSKASLCEISSPFMHLAKKTRNPVHFALFALVFSCCRMFWIPFLLYQLRQTGLGWTDFRIICLIAFYGLNWFWYSKILRILIDGIRQPKDKKES